MARLPKTRRYVRVSLGADGDTGRRNVCHISFVKNDLRAPQAVSNTALLSSTNLNNGSSTSVAITPNPDVPRNVSVTLGGTVASIGAGNVVVTGTNFQNAVISENIAVTAGTGGTLSGNKAFFTVTNVTFPATTGAGVTATVGYGNKIGIGLCNLASGQVRTWSKPVAGQENNTETLVAPTSSNLDPTVVENNTVVLAGTMNGQILYWVYVLNYNWAVHPVPTKYVNVFGLK